MLKKLETLALLLAALLALAVEGAFVYWMRFHPLGARGSEPSLLYVGHWMSPTLPQSWLIGSLLALLYYLVVILRPPAELEPKSSSITGGLSCGFGTGFWRWPALRAVPSISATSRSCDDENLRPAAGTSTYARNHAGGCSRPGSCHPLVSHLHWACPILLQLSATPRVVLLFHRSP